MLCRGLHFRLLTTARLATARPITPRRPSSSLKLASSADHASSFSARSAKENQEKASKNLMTLLKASDPEAMAAAMVDDLDETFFLIASTYLEMAKKESESFVVEKLEPVIRIAMKAKNRSLRPEIQLLNELLAEDSKSKRNQILNSNEHKETLKMNDQYFIKLIKKMRQDVEKQPKSNQKEQVLESLNSILEEAQRILNV